MGKPILIVDDSASIRQMLSFTLKSAGYEVDEAADGKEGLGKPRARATAWCSPTRTCRTWTACR